MNISNNTTSIQNNQNFLNTTAKNIEKGDSNLTKDITSLGIAEDVNAVNISAIKTQDEILGSLLDIKV